MHAKGMGSNKKPLDSHQKVAQHIVATRSKDYFNMLCRLFAEVSQADFLRTIVVVAVGSLFLPLSRCIKIEFPEPKAPPSRLNIIGLGAFSGPLGIQC